MADTWVEIGMLGLPDISYGLKYSEYSVSVEADIVM
jgi:hypothetical protein